jgi:hypothetical protein
MSDAVSELRVRATVVRLLRERGHDVFAVKESIRGADDPEILARAQAEAIAGETRSGLKELGLSDSTTLT